LLDLLAKVSEALTNTLVSGGIAMNTVKFLLIACCLLALASTTTGVINFPTSAVAQEQKTDPSKADKLVYADFENAVDNRPVSSRNGFVQVLSYEENPTLKSSFKGLQGASPAAPEVVRTSKDSPNRAISFDYSLVGPNNWAGVTVEIHGQPDKDGATVPDDVSGYKYLTMQVYATGVPSLRVEFISRGQGISVSNGYPQMTFKITPGFNTYKIPFKSLGQPEWAEPKVSTKDVLKKLTSVNVTAFCGPCTPVSGTVVIDNLVFQN
jgi:hypothetical protein